MASPLLRRLALPLVALVSAAVVAVPAPAQAAGTTDPAAGAAGWLARQLTDGDHLETEFSGTKYPDQGLTIDAVLAFVAADVAGASVTKAVDWLTSPSNVSGYIGDGAAESYVGGTAKLAYLATVLGEDPTSFGGVDLVARLGDRLDASGQYKDKSAFGEFSNVFGQALAILALSRTPGGAPTGAVQFLAGVQCADGGFPVFYGPCDTGDPDGTAMAVQALLAGGDPTTAAEGLTWLLARQDGVSGGFAGTGTGGLNANSTALAAQALRASGKDSEAGRAAAFLASLQVGCAGPTEHVGAIALSRLDPAVPDSGFQLGNAPRATAGAVLGLAGVNLSGLTLNRDIAPDAPTLTVDCPAPAPAPVLAVTGASLSWVVLAGAALLVVGVALVVLVRVRRRPTA
jgi:hypothetical protein